MNPSVIDEILGWNFKFSECDVTFAYMNTIEKPAPLIPLNVLFAEPEKDEGRLSPDGRLLLYLAPIEGKLGVWVRTLGSEDDRPVAFDRTRPIHWARWQGDSKHVLYLQDRGGDENYDLFRVDLAGGAPERLTSGGGTRALPLAIDARFPDELLITLNGRKPSLMDVHRIHFPPGEMVLDTENPGDVLQWLADHQLNVRAAIAKRADGGYAIRKRDRVDSEWAVLDEHSFEDGTPRLIAFSPDNQLLYAVTSKGSETSRLVQYELASGVCTTLFEHPEFDVATVYVDPGSREIGAIAVLEDKLVWTPMSPAMATAFGSLAERVHGEISNVTGSSDGSALLFRCQMDTMPAEYYLYESNKDSVTLLFQSSPKLLNYVLAPMKPIAFLARDGLRIHGYLTLPAALEGTPLARGLPTVLVVHGGPWFRDRWGFEPTVQWLANRGYAVLQVNFRGSSGYGKAFLNAGNREWAGAMRTDLLDAMDWAISEGVADPQRCAILGGSYGGYAVLTALAWSPDAFRCGIDIVGPSDLTTFMESIPAYWEPMRKMFSERVGEDAGFLKAQSPLYRVSSIRAPLMIVQGANDPRVKQRESDQMVDALRAKGNEVEYLVFENEGHGLAHEVNVQHFVTVAEDFLARHMAK
jgi:dipeptidyl aminopeptidase/acylaminoacyl peptidase